VTAITTRILMAGSMATPRRVRAWLCGCGR
jgi:hypothetical protein